MKKARAILGIITIMALLMGSVPFMAQPAAAADEPWLNLPPIVQPEKGNPKLDSQLNQLASAKPGEAAGFAQQSNIQLVDDKVRIVAECVPGQVDAATKTATTLGAVETSYGDYLQVLVPVSQLTALADTPSIQLVRLPYYAIEAVTSEGVGLINADDWQSANYTGAGIKIGILDGGFSGYSSLLGTELPATVGTWWAPSIGGPGSSVHGTACAEIAYDAAPGAQFYLANYGTDVEMGNAVSWLIGQGVNVISHSMGWFLAGPGNGTGPICQMVDGARAAGIVWSNAMGNHAQRHWQGNFADTEPDGIHNFTPTDESNKITVTSIGQVIAVGLKWNDPWGSSANDYDLYLFNNTNPTTPVAASARTQNGSGTPWEQIVYTAPSTGTYHIVIAKYAATQVVNFHLYVYNYFNLQYQVASSSLLIPSDSPNAMALGAVPYSTPTTLEPFSSQGPTTDSRIKPDLVAPDGVSTATYGASAFFGTSASAPHAAGAAALVKQAYPSYTPAQIQSFLEGRTFDLGTAGKDNLFGSGRLDLGTPPSLAGLGSISGYVSDNTTPISGAQIDALYFDSLTGKWVSYSSAQSGADGSYTITGLPTGQYIVRGKAAGYATEYYNNVYYLNQATLVPVTTPPVGPPATAGINFVLGPGGSISGRVYQSDNITPIANMHIMAFNAATGQWVESTNTNSSGNYTISGLSDDSYKVKTYALQNGLSYIDKWYDNVSNQNLATPVSVTVPNNTPNINFSLSIGGSISGHIYQSDGTTPIAGVRIEVFDYNSMFSSNWVNYGGATTTADGSYTTPGLPSGQYGIRVKAPGYATEYYNNVHYRDQAIPVTVTTPNNTPNIDFTLQPGGSISGRVYQSDNITPIANMHIQAFNATTGQWIDSTNTNSSGNYTLSGLPGGSYKVKTYAQQNGLSYTDKWYNNVSNQNQATSIPVTAPNNTPNINFSLSIGGSISGHVYQSDNTTPISGARIEVFSYDPITGRTVKYGGAQTQAAGYAAAGLSTEEAVTELFDSSSMNEYGSTATDTIGSYTVSGLPTGQYIVRAVASGYAAEWYQNTYNMLEATPISVTAPNNIPNINFGLDLGGSISGYVYQSDNTTPISGAKIDVFYYDPVSGKRFGYGWATTEINGYYVTTGLPTGEYILRVVASGYATEWYQNTYNMLEATPVSVTAPNNTPNINFALEIGGTISGHVYPVPGAQIDVFDYDSLSSSWVSYGWATTGADGSYTTTSLPTGIYGVRVTAPGYITEWYDNTYYKDEATPVAVTASNNTPNIDFTINPGGSISGHVYQSDNTTPIPYCQVFATDNETQQWIAGVNADSQGNYTLSGLPSGSYKLRTYALGSGLNYVDEWYNNVYAFDEATSVTVTAPNTTPNINFTLEGLVPRATIAEAIDDGVTWLAAQPNPDGSWGTQYPVAKTGLAVLKLETHATSENISPFAPGYAYHTQVENGLNYIFSQAHTINISMQPAGNPDGDSDGIGIYFYSPASVSHPSHSVDIYEASIAMMAIAASADPGRVVSVLGSPVNGWTYQQVMQDAVDYMAWGQTDSGFGRGAWSYNAMNNAGSRSDQSNSGWVTLGLAYAEDFGISIPGFVRSELDIWIDYIQDDVNGDANDGGAWYTGPGDPQSPMSGANILRTGNLLQQMAFVGNTADTPRVQDAIDFIVRHWSENYDPGWRGYPTCYHSTYTTMKGLEALGIVTIDSIDWFQCFTDAILSEQAAAGWWMSSRYDTGDQILSTTWALLTLEKAIPPTMEKPDLVISEKHEEWVSEPAGTYRVYFTIQNKGNAEAPAGHSARLYVDDVSIETKNITQALAPGATYSDNFTAVITLSGDRDKIRVRADALNNVDELNETNNSLTNLWPPAPDLTIYEKHEEWVVQGQSYKVYCTVKNIGNAPAPAGRDARLTVDGVTIEEHEMGFVLAPGESYSGNFTTVITLTGNRDDVAVFADANREVAELNEGNNEQSNTIAWPQAPDLRISKWETWVIQRESYQVSYTVRNRGNALAPAGHDVRLTVDNVTIEQQAVNMELAPGESYSGTFTTTVTLTGGVDKVKVTADINGEVNESREDNNSYENTFAWPEAPDLIINNKYERWVTGQSGNYTVYYTVRNIGNAPAPAGHDVRLTVDGTVIATKSVPVDLAASQSYSDSFSTVITISGNSDNITVLADANAEVTESDETNNGRTNTWSAPSVQPDLRIYEKHEEWVVDGQSYTVHYTIKNSGTGTAPPDHNVGLRVDGIVIEQREVSEALAPGENCSGSFNTVITLSGSWDSVLVEADVNREITESNEWNNRQLNTIAWPPAPELVVSKWETWVVQGQSYRVYYTVRNQGNAPALAGHDVGLEVDGVPIGSPQAVDVALAPGESYSGNFTTVVTLTGGVDKVKVTADINEEVAESREDNNSYLNTFASSAAPDLIIMMKSEKWVEGQVGTQYTVNYVVRNIGNAPAPAGHDVKLTVDGTVIELKAVPIELPSHQLYTDTFSTVITISGNSDNITVWADANNEIAESDETNNYLTNSLGGLGVGTTVEVNSGNTITLGMGGSQSGIPLGIKNIPDLGIDNGVGGFTFNLSWNKDVIHVDNITAATIAGFAILPGIPNNTTGTVTISGFSMGTVYLTDNVTVATLGISAVGNVGDATTLAVAVTALGDKEANPIPATPVQAPVQISNLVAETSLAQAKDSDDVAVVSVNIDRIKDPATGLTTTIPGGIGSYTATASSAAAGGIQLLNVRGVPPFDNPTFNPNSGIFAVFGVSSPPQADNTTVAKVVPRLTGDANTTYTLTVTFQVIGAASGPELNVPEEHPNSLTFRRGDSTKNGLVDIFDAMFIAQYIVGRRPLNELNVLNAASVKQDGTSGDKIDIFDAMFIAQYIVGFRDAYFVWQ